MLPLYDDQLHYVNIQQKAYFVDFRKMIILGNKNSRKAVLKFKKWQKVKIKCTYASYKSNFNLLGLFIALFKNIHYHVIHMPKVINYTMVEPTRKSLARIFLSF